MRPARKRAAPRPLRRGALKRRKQRETETEETEAEETEESSSKRLRRTTSSASPPRHRLQHHHHLEAGSAVPPGSRRPGSSPLGPRRRPAPGRREGPTKALTTTKTKTTTTAGRSRRCRLMRRSSRLFPLRFCLRRPRSEPSEAVAIRSERARRRPPSRRPWRQRVCNWTLMEVMRRHWERSSASSSPRSSSRCVRALDRERSPASKQARGAEGESEVERPCGYSPKPND